MLEKRRKNVSGLGKRVIRKGHSGGGVIGKKKWGRPRRAAALV